MRLESARDLKKELAHKVGDQFRIRPEVLNQASLSAPASQRFDEKPPIAMGIAHHKGEHKIAIRVHHSDPEVDKLIDHMRTAAKGEIDVRFVGRVHAQTSRKLPQQSRHRPLRIGDSVGLDGMDMGAGTIACFATSNNGKDKRTFVLSNNHVLALENNAKAGMPILQPGPADGGNVDKDAIATLERYITLEKQGNTVDAAIAAVDDGVDVDVEGLPGLGKLQGVRSEKLESKEKVFKIGRTSGLTEGEVSAFEIDGLRVSYPYPLLTLTFDDQMEVGVESGDGPFSKGGDSGSLVVDADHHAIGLLFAGNDTSVTYINHVHSIVDKLGIALLTGSR